MEYYLSNSKPNFMLLSETQVAKNSSFNSFNISNYNLFYNFRLKGGVCAYVNINTPKTRLENLESSNFDVLWLKIFLPSLTIILCFCYCSPNRTDFHAFFDYLTTSHETVISLSLIHISEPTRLLSISYAVFCLKKKKIFHCKI